tara:strand:- start:293 stop:709 length:417 start_codon:yes stop_codon:yes gene_type:complete
MSQGIGWAHATGLVKQVLPSFSGSVMGDVYYKVTQEREQTDYISSLGAYEVPDNDHYIERALDHPSNYRYVGEFTYFDETSGKTFKEYKSYYSNKKLSPSEAGQLMFDSFDSSRYRKDIYIKNITVKNIEHNELWDYE